MSSLAYGPGGASIAIPTGPAPSYQKLIEDDPFYRQNLEFIQGDAATQKARLLQDQALAEQLYNLNVQQANQSVAGMGGPVGDYGLAAAEARAKLDRESAAHENVNRLEYLREALASRGMSSSGQQEWEKGEQGFQYGMQEKQIQADLDARKQAAADSAASAAQARASAQAGLALQLQEMALRHTGQTTEYGRALEDLPTGVAKATGEAAFETYQRLMQSGVLGAPTEMATWDPTTSTYVTKGGQHYDANGNLVNVPAAAGTGGGGGGGGGGGLPPSSIPPPYYEDPAVAAALPGPAPIWNPTPGKLGYT